MNISYDMSLTTQRQLRRY